MEPESALPVNGVAGPDHEWGGRMRKDIPVNDRLSGL
jgi:hypothetical protein